MKKYISVLISIVIVLSMISGTASVADAATLSKVSGVEVISKTTTSVKLKWKKVSKATGYQIYCSTSKSKDFKKAKTINGGKTISATVSKLKSNKTYYFKVRAINNKAKGKFSKTVSDKTKKEWGTISNVKIKLYGVCDYYSWEKEGPGFACVTVDFKEVKDADGYQVKLYQNKEYTTYKKIKSNKFYYATQEICPKCKVRAYKKKSDGSKKYGPWKKVDLNKRREYCATYYLEDFETKIESKYECVNE